MKIETLRDLYKSIPATVPVDTTPKALDKEVFNKTVEHLNKTPIFTPKVK